MDKVVGLRFCEKLVLLGLVATAFALFAKGAIEVPSEVQPSAHSHGAQHSSCACCTPKVKCQIAGICCLQKKAQEL